MKKARPPGEIPSIPYGGIGVSENKSNGQYCEEKSPVDEVMHYLSSEIGYLQENIGNLSRRIAPILYKTDQPTTSCDDSPGVI